MREDVLLTQLAEFGANPGGHDLDDRNQDDVPSRAAAMVSSLKAAAVVIVHDGMAWELAAIR